MSLSPELLLNRAENTTHWERAWQELACKEHRYEIRKMTASNGSVQWRRQCVVCGESSAALKSADVSYTDKQNAVEFDRELRAELTRRVGELANSFRMEEANRKRSQWWDGYNKYLASPQWREKRSLVMKRANGVCEGCGKFPASQVHHLTYDHVGNELLFELVAVCNACHELVHNKGAA